MAQIKEKELPLPEFYRASNAANFNYCPNHQALFEAADKWRKAHHIGYAQDDTFNLHLLGIDLQKDFCFPEGALFVGGRTGLGAIEDNKRIASFVYRNLNRITNMTLTLDTHFAFQIFFASFWVDADSEPLMPFMEISTKMIQNKEVRPNPAISWWLCGGDYPWLRKQVEFYCKELEKAGKYKLYLWPPHTIIGSDGHALAGVIHECRMFQSFVRGVQSWTQIKGKNALTENYSVLSPEVLLHHDGTALSGKNKGFIRTLQSADALVICGQAASHCVKSTIEDLLREIMKTNPGIAKKVYILKDCMSSVVVLDDKGRWIEDFTPLFEDALEKFSAAGIHVVKSVDPIDGWPGIYL